MTDMQPEMSVDWVVGLLCVICDLDEQRKVSDVFEKCNSYFSLVCLGKGTASSKTISYLGLGEKDKIVFFKVMSMDRAYQAMQALDESLQLYKPGRGISFFVEMRQGYFHHLVEFHKDDSGGETMQRSSPYSLIFVILNHGFSEEVMDAARAAGATGGTVLHARGHGSTGVERFFGMTIAPEKDILMIVALEGVAGAIMASIADKTGPATEACAISFSLPVNAVKGIPV